MDEPLFDQSFYDAFAQNTLERIDTLRAAAAGYAAGALPYSALLESARLPLHNISGEARLLDLFDLASNVSRLSTRIGRIGTPDKPAMSALAAQYLVACAEALKTFTTAVAARHDSAETERNQFVQALVAFENTP